MPASRVAASSAGAPAPVRAPHETSTNARTHQRKRDVLRAPAELGKRARPSEGLVGMVNPRATSHDRGSMRDESETL